MYKIITGRALMKKYGLVFLFSISILAITACATPVLDVSQVNPKLTHSTALAQFDNLKGQKAFWGGTILSGKNLKDKTELEILAYPIDGYGEPIKDSPAYGRFIAIWNGYLELGEYAKERQVSVVGKLTHIHDGLVGESNYQYPVLQVQQINLWPEEVYYPYDDSDVRFHFGIGVFHRF